MMADTMKSSEDKGDHATESIPRSAAAKESEEAIDTAGDTAKLIVGTGIGTNRPPPYVQENGMEATADTNVGIGDPPLAELVPPLLLPHVASNTQVGAVSIQDGNQSLLQPGELSAAVGQQNLQSPSLSGATGTNVHINNDTETLVEATLVPEESVPGIPQEQSPPGTGTTDSTGTGTLLVEAEPLGFHLSTRTSRYVLIFGLLLCAAVGAGIAAAAVTVNSNSDQAIPEPTIIANTSATTNEPTTATANNTKTDVTLPPPHLSTLARIRQRGVLRCGVALEVVMRGFHREEGEENMMDTEMCRSFAAAALGRDAYKIRIVQVPFDQRSQALQDGQVDMMHNAFGLTMDREVYDYSIGAGIKFATPHTFITSGFGGLQDMVACADHGLRHIQECADLRVCVLQGTRQMDTLALQLPRNNIVEVDSYNTAFEQFVNGTCNVVLVASILHFNAVMREHNYTGEFYPSPGVFLTEPLAPATRADDPEWSDFVDIVKLSWFTAERYGITRDNVDDEAAIHKFKRPLVVGAEFQNMLYDAIAVTGNYGEMYDRRIISELYPRMVYHYGVNESCNGFLVSRPFGRQEVTGPPPRSNGTMAGIIRRGRLRCGVGVSSSVPAVEKQQELADGLVGLQGMDVEFCKAVASGLLGSSETLEVVKVTNDTNGFSLLQDGQIDILAGAPWNIETEVREPTTGVGFSFSQPYFYNTPVVDIVGSNMLSNRCLATRQSDHEWATAVKWIVEAIIFAEENGITKETSNKMPTVSLYGIELSRIFRDAVNDVGDYADIWNRTVPETIPRQGRNLLFDGANPSPLIPIIPGLLEY